MSGLPADSVSALFLLHSLHSDVYCLRAVLALQASAGLFVSTPCVFDICLSGINRGNNIGLHTLYSGTCGAAREAAAKGVPAVAISLDSHSRTASYDAATAVVIPLVLRLLARPDALRALRGYVINVNVPALPLAELMGISVTHTSFACTMPGFVPVQAPEGKRGWRNSDVGGCRVDTSAGCDAAAVAAGFVSISLLPLIAEASPPPGLDTGVVHPVAGGASVDAVIDALLARVSRTLDVYSLLVGDVAPAGATPA